MKAHGDLGPDKHAPMLAASFVDPGTGAGGRGGRVREPSAEQAPRMAAVMKPQFESPDHVCNGELAGIRAGAVP